MRQRVPRRVAFRLSLLPELWQCRVDPQAVQALVLDLVDAAAADLKGSGELVVGTRNFAFTEATLAATPGAQLGEYVRVTVRDNGPGLSDEALDRVFDAGGDGAPVGRAGGRDDAAARRLCPGRERRGRRHRRPSVFPADRRRRGDAGKAGRAAE